MMSTVNKNILNTSEAANVTGGDDLMIIQPQNNIYLYNPYMGNGNQQPYGNWNQPPQGSWNQPPQYNNNPYQFYQPIQQQ